MSASPQALLNSLRRRSPHSHATLSPSELDTLLSLANQGLLAHPLMEALDEIEAATGPVLPRSPVPPVGNLASVEAVRQIHQILLSTVLDRAAFRAQAKRSLPSA